MYVCMSHTPIFVYFTYIYRIYIHTYSMYAYSAKQEAKFKHIFN